MNRDNVSTFSLLCIGAALLAVLGCKSADSARSSGERASEAPGEAAAPPAAGPAARAPEPVAVVQPTAEERAACQDISNWPAEKFALDGQFGPRMPAGREELRFSPGWRSAASPDRLTYAFAMDYDSPYKLERAGLEQLMTDYYDRLMSGVAQGRGIELPANHTAAKVEQVGEQFTATVDTYDAFDTGKPVTLHLKFHEGGESCLIVAASARPFDNDVWSSLERAVTCLAQVCADGTTS